MRTSDNGTSGSRDLGSVHAIATPLTLTQATWDMLTGKLHEGLLHFCESTISLK